MEHLHGWGKRGQSPVAEERSPSSFVGQREQSIKHKKGTHLSERMDHSVMVSMETSAMSCGDDDWSVDSNYTFEDDAIGGRSTTLTGFEEKIRSPSGESVSVTGEAPPPNPGLASTGEEEGGVGTNERVHTNGTFGRDGEIDETEAFWNANDFPTKSKVLCESPLEGTRQQARGEPGSSTESMHILRVEQRMFLKAAFQLLEERDRQFPPTSCHGNHAFYGLDSAWPTSPKADVGETATFSAAETTGTVDVGCNGDVVNGGVGYGRGMTGCVIKSGILRKATARSVGRLEAMTWKIKHVELTPGWFAYADSQSVLGKRRSKVIPLHLGFCTCRSVKADETSGSRANNAHVPHHLSSIKGGRDKQPANRTCDRRMQEPRGGERGGIGVPAGADGKGRDGGVSKHLLEIIVLGSKRRVWAAESDQERRRWVSFDLEEWRDDAGRWGKRLRGPLRPGTPSLCTGGDGVADDETETDLLSRHSEYRILVGQAFGRRPVGSIVIKSGAPRVSKRFCKLGFMGFDKAKISPYRGGASGTVSCTEHVAIKRISSLERLS